jgi:excisionase family DNA binding protein
MGDAAQAGGGGAAGTMAGAGVGLGAGVGMGAAMASAIAEAMKGGGAAAPAMPDVMTVEEAAQFLKVSPDDLQSLIDSGDLKAKKVGKTYRITKAALEAYLKG